MGSRARNLLVIDWDYFGVEESEKYPMMYDWGHREAPLFIEGLWPMRAAAFLARACPLPRLSGKQVGFWDRFRFARGAVCHVSESNVMAASDAILPTRLKTWDSVWLYDAHHDAGYRSFWEIYRSTTLDCGEWSLAFLSRGATHHVRYPRWKTWAFKVEPYAGFDELYRHRIDRAFDDEAPNPVRFTHVFVCRSGAWMPSWHDPAFFRFLADCPVPVNILDSLGVREWSWREARREARKMKLMLTTIDQQNTAQRKERS